MNADEHEHEHEHDHFLLFLIGLRDLNWRSNPSMHWLQMVGL